MLLYRYDSLFEDHKKRGTSGGGSVRDLESIINSVDAAGGFEEGTMELGIMICMNDATSEQVSSIVAFRKWCDENNNGKFTAEFNRVSLESAFGMWYTITGSHPWESVCLAFGDANVFIIKIPIENKDFFVKCAREFLAKTVS